MRERKHGQDCKEESEAGSQGEGEDCREAFGQRPPQDDGEAFDREALDCEVEGSSSPRRLTADVDIDVHDRPGDPAGFPADPFLVSRLYRSASVSRIFGFEHQPVAFGSPPFDSPRAFPGELPVRCRDGDSRRSLKSHFECANRSRRNVRNGDFRSAARTPISCRIVQSKIQNRAVTSSKCPKLWTCSNTTD